MTRAEKEEKILNLPLPEGMTRMESGPVSFGDDWPGYFLRGDNAAQLVSGVHLLDFLFKHPEHFARFSTQLQLSSNFGWARSMSACLLMDDEPKEERVPPLLLEEALDALQDLYDEQNDAPLERHRANWQAAMDKASVVLRRWHEAQAKGEAA